jgi:hypothetical protein
MGCMRLRYETGIATLVQFVFGVGLSLIGGAASVINGCHGHAAAECASNTLVSLLLIIITATVLAAIAAFGYIAQERRSTRLALILIGIEGMAALFYLFDAKQSLGLLERISNLISFVVAGWVVVIAVALAQSHGRRIVSGGRRHRVVKP